MKKFIGILLFFVVFFCGNIFASEDKEMDIKQFYNKMYNFMIDKDVLSLGKMLDDNFVLIHMTGLKQNKKDFLNSINNGTLNYFSNETENIIIENKLKFIGQSKVSAAVFGGGKHTWNLELTIELTENNLIKKITASTY